MSFISLKLTAPFIGCGLGWMYGMWADRIPWPGHPGVGQRGQAKKARPLSGG